MKILLLDISGKVTKYSFYVANIMYDNLNKDDVIETYSSFYSVDEANYNLFNHGMKYHRLINLIPRKYKSSFSIFKRVVKSIEVLMNYLLIILILKLKKINILHTQYIPFADFIGIEYYIFSLFKLLCPKLKIVLTIHDVLPHDLKAENLNSYCSRYAKVALLFDAFMVHTESCKNDVIKYLNLPEEKIHVAYHPIFKSAFVKPITNTIKPRNKIKMIVFGLITPYKGVDILIESLELLPLEIIQRLELTIAGSIDSLYLSHLKSLAKKSAEAIVWHPHFIPEKDLDNMINNSNIIILPYRSISQSGVLLLSLYFKKLIVTSNLPSFLETLEGYKPEWFFESENPKSLANLLQLILEERININEQQIVINQLNEKYSPSRFANDTISVYKSLLN